MTDFRPSLQEIEKVLKDKFNIPFIYDTPDSKEDINGFHFFTYAFDNIVWENPCIWNQHFEIAYVSNEQTDLKEREIWEVLKGVGLRVEPDIKYSRFYLSDKSVTVDVVTFRCTRSVNFMGR